MNRQQLREIIQRRTAFVRERILHNLAFSRAHEKLTCPEREELADKLAVDAMSFDQAGYNGGVAPATAWEPGSKEFDRMKQDEEIPNEPSVYRVKHESEVPSDKG